MKNDLFSTMVSKVSFVFLADPDAFSARTGTLLKRLPAAFTLVLLLQFLSGQITQAQVSVGLNTSVVSETPLIGEEFFIQVSYGVISNVGSLTEGYILVDFPGAFEYVSLSPTSHIYYPTRPNGGGPSPEIITDPMDGKRKLKIYFISSKKVNI